MSAPLSPPITYRQALEQAAAKIAELKTPKPTAEQAVTATAAAADTIISARDRASARAKRAIHQLWAAVNPYDETAVAEFAVQAARIMAAAQQAAAKAAAVGQAHQLAAVGAKAPATQSVPLDVRAPAAVIKNGLLVLRQHVVSVDYAGGSARVSEADMSTLAVFKRPAAVHRYAKSQGATDVQAAALAGERIDDLIDDNLMLAQRLAQQQVLMAAAELVDLDGRPQAKTKIIGYRRVIHPELSRGGTCGMCIAASDRIYYVAELMPIHAHCKCTIAAITEDYDPADDLNAVDLNHLYKDAGGTSVAHLKRTRYKVDQHGELGPVLVPKSKYKPRTTKSKVRVGGTALQDDQPAQAEVARQQLRVMEENLARLRSEGEPEGSSKIAYHEKLIAKLREQAGGEESGTAGSSSGDAGTSADRVTRGGVDRPPPNSGGVAVGAFDDDDRAKYRATPPDQRELDPRYAQPLGDVVDAAAKGDRGPLKQLAADLSGVVTARGGEFVVTFGSNSLGDAAVEGRIHFDGSSAGAGLIGRTFRRDAAGKLVVSNDALFLGDAMQNRGLAAALAPRLEAYYRRSGVDRIEVHAADTGGGYAWARQNFDWDPDKVEESIGSVVQRIIDVSNKVKSHEARQALADMQARLVDERGNIRPIDQLPSPREIADLATSDVSDLGKQVMMGSNWYGQKYL